LIQKKVGDNMFRLFGMFSCFALLVISTAFVDSTKAQDNPDLMGHIKKAISLNYGDANQFDYKIYDSNDVQVKGIVNSLYDKIRVYDIITKVKGVNHISDYLIVNTDIIPDDQIKDDLIFNLHESHSISEPDRIKVDVDNGVVFLSGNVSYPKEKIMSETLSALEDGARGVVNNINIISPRLISSDRNIHKELSELLRDYFPLDQRVSIKVKNGVVILNGYVVRPWDENHIVNKFSKVDGVKDIINSLRIKPTYYL
jgi:osmotically-inducible protein OsmY